MSHTESEHKQEEEEFTVEKIVAKRTVNGQVQYCIKWYGFSDIDNSWEPKENLNCEELLKEFEKKFKKKGKVTTKMEQLKHGSALSESTVRKEFEEESGQPKHGNKRALSKSTIVSGAFDAGPTKEQEKTFSAPKQNANKSLKLDLTVKENDKTEYKDRYKSEEKDNEEVIVPLKREADNKEVIVPLKREAEKIVGVGLVDDKINQGIKFLVKWKGLDELSWIESNEANLMFPQIVIAFYEERLKL